MMLHGLINQLLTTFANTVCANFIALNTNAYGFTAFRADQHHIRNVDRGFELNAARIHLAAILQLLLLLVLGADIHARHHYAVIIGHHIDDLATFAFVFEAATDYFDGIAFTDLYFHTITPASA